MFKADKNISVQIFALDIDGSADGIFTNLIVKSNQFFIVKNHPLACFKFKSDSLIESIIFKANDESTLASFELSAESCSLINPEILKVEKLKDIRMNF